MENKFYANYIVPEIEVLEMSVECGFAASTDFEDPMVNPEAPWD